ncbi:MAG: hypothetical protein ACLSCV_03410 [Acutalibacteraceae bacterium]
MVVIVGPTASGKQIGSRTGTLAANGNCISRFHANLPRNANWYAKPTVEEMEGIAHHLIDFVELNEPFSVADYVAQQKHV